MHPNKIKVGQRVRAVQTGRDSYTPTCVGTITAINTGGSARVAFDDGWMRIYFNPAEDLVAWEEVADLEHLMEENKTLRELLEAEIRKNEILSREARAALELANKAITSLEKVL